MNNLSKKIITTLAYYDVMDYPMTAFELWKYLIGSHDEGSDQEETPRMSDIMRELENQELRKRVEEYQGFYFLKGRKGLVEQRIERNKISEKKFKRVKKIAWFLRFVPFVRMIAVTGRLAMKNAEKTSDLDLLIVLKHGHIFTGRSFVTLVTHLMGVRRYGEKIQNRICLNFFITDQSLEINIKDLFSSSEYYFIWPLFGYGTFRQFQKKNQWIREFKENYTLEEAANLKGIRDSDVSKLIRSIGEIILSSSRIENWLKGWQTKRIENDPRTHLAGSMVMADDDALIFLPKPQGPEIFEKFQKRTRELSAN